MANNDEEVIDRYEDLVRFLASSLLDDDVEIEVRGRSKRDQWRIELHVPPEHRGRVIGRGGRIARSMRTLLDKAAIPSHQSVILDIVD